MRSPCEVRDPLQIRFRQVIERTIAQSDCPDLKDLCTGPVAARGFTDQKTRLLERLEQAGCRGHRQFNRTGYVAEGDASLPGRDLMQHPQGAGDASRSALTRRLSPLGVLVHVLRLHRPGQRAVTPETRGAALSPAPPSHVTPH